MISRSANGHREQHLEVVNIDEANKYYGGIISIDEYGNYTQEFYNFIFKIKVLTEVGKIEVREYKMNKGPGPGHSLYPLL